MQNSHYEVGKSLKKQPGSDMERLPAPEGRVSLPRSNRLTSPSSTLLSEKLLGPLAPRARNGHGTGLWPKTRDRPHPNTPPSSGAVSQVWVLLGTHTLQFSLLCAEVQNFLIEIKPSRIKGHSSWLIPILISELPTGFVGSLVPCVINYTPKCARGTYCQV